MFNLPKPTPYGITYSCVSDSKSGLIVKFDIVTNHGIAATTATATGTTAEEKEKEGKEKGYKEERCWC